MSFDLKGLVIYFGYGVTHSAEAETNKQRFLSVNQRSSSESDIGADNPGYDSKDSS